MVLNPSVPATPRLHVVVDASACELDDLAPCGGVEVTVGADVGWADLVQRAVTSAWPGVERLGKLPGTVADVVRANPEVDGQTPGQAVASVATWDRSRERRTVFAFAECGFAPSQSRFQERLADGLERYDLLEVTFLFQQGEKTAPIRDPQLAAVLGIAPGERLPLAQYAARRHPAAD